MSREILLVAYQCFSLKFSCLCLSFSKFFIHSLSFCLFVFCSFHRCVADNLPKFAHCNNSTAGQDAATQYHRFTGSDMPSCYGEY